MHDSSQTARSAAQSGGENVCGAVAHKRCQNSHPSNGLEHQAYPSYELHNKSNPALKFKNDISNLYN